MVKMGHFHKLKVASMQKKTGTYQQDENSSSVRYICEKLETMKTEI
jgi:hypothetical protein